MIRVLSVSEYRGCKVYIRNFGETFEYLAIVQDELYSAHIVVLKTPLQKMLRRDFTAKQLQDTNAYILKMAQTTIDLVLGK